MLDWLTDSSASSAPVSSLVIAMRLIAACIFGFAVAVAYRNHRYPTPIPETFPLTLVLLSILIAMVMQVIDDRVARAFSLVGALSIVRFRTVLDDTQDIAFVIFAVVVGMASGTGAIGVAAIGSVIMIGTLWAARLPVFGRSKTVTFADSHNANLVLRTAIGTDYEQTVAPLLDTNFSSHRLTSTETARGGSMLEWTYSVRLKQGISVATLIERCCRCEGIQNVSLQMHDKSN